jgi:hypothetical protein
MPTYDYACADCDGTLGSAGMGSCPGMHIAFGVSYVRT